MEGRYVVKLISVVIPLYNSEKYISECVHSIIDNYKYDDLEIIIVNDGSTDKSQGIVKELVEIDKRIIMINQDNKGPSAARNRGLAKANGKYILFVDSDDFLESRALTHFRELLVKGNYDTVIFNYKRFTENNETFNNKPLFANEYKYSYKDKKDLYRRLVATSDLNHPVAKYYSMKIVKEKKIKFDESISIGEDRIFNMEYFYFSNSGVYHDLYLYNYRYNPGSLTKTFKMSKFLDLKQTHIARMDYIKKYDLDQDTVNKANIFTINSLFQLVSTAINIVNIKEVNEIIDDPLFVELVNETKAVGIKDRFKLLTLKRKLLKLMRLLQRIGLIKGW